MDTETGAPTDTLAPVAAKTIAALGSSSVSISNVIDSRDKAVFAAIADGLERANTNAPTIAHRVQ